jgi:hypothetical protein
LLQCLEDLGKSEITGFPNPSGVKALPWTIRDVVRIFPGFR